MSEKTKKDKIVEETKEEVSVDAEVVADKTVEEKKEEVLVEEPKKEESKKEEVKEDEGESSSAEATKDKEVEVPKKFKKLVEEIESMSVIDLHELVKLLEKKFGVSAAAVAVAGGSVAGDADEGEEKTSFNVELTSVGDQKIAVIKAIKASLGLGLKEAKELVDGAPAMLKEGMKKEDAEILKTEIETAGGSIELK